MQRRSNYEIPDERRIKNSSYKTIFNGTDGVHADVRLLKESQTFAKFCHLYLWFASVQHYLDCGTCTFQSLLLGHVLPRFACIVQATAGVQYCVQYHTALKGVLLRVLCVDIKGWYYLQKISTNFLVSQSSAWQGAYRWSIVLLMAVYLHSWTWHCPRQLQWAHRVAKAVPHPNYFAEEQLGRGSVSDRFAYCANPIQDPLPNLFHSSLSLLLTCSS